MTHVHETEIDGVRCFWVESGRPTLSASLLFRAGLVDESFTQHGWHHLLEHSALHGRDSGTLGVNGSVSLTTTSFDAHGPIDRVVDHFADISRWLADPDLSDIARESGVLKAEQRTRGWNPSADALVWRYGAQGPGLAATDEFGLSRATAEGLTALAATAYVRGNAVLALDGPPPPGLRLHLVDGHHDGPLALPSAAPCEWSFPGQYPTRGLVISGTVTRSETATMLPAVLQNELRRQFRDRDGASYAPWCTYEAVDATTAVVLAGSDLGDEIAPGCAHVAHGIVKRLAEHGPDPDELGDLIARTAQGMRDPYNASGFAWRAAHLSLAGTAPESPAAVVAAIEAITPASVAVPAQEFLRTILLGSPEAAERAPGYRAIERPPAPKVQGKRFRSTNWPADGSVLTVNETHIAASSATSNVAVAFDDVVGMVRHSGGIREIVARDSWNFTLDPVGWSRGHEVVSLLDQRVPVELHVAALTDRAAEKGARMSWLRRWWYGLNRLLGARDGAAYGGSTVAVLGVALVITGIAFDLPLGIVGGLFWVGIGIYRAFNDDPPVQKHLPQDMRDNTHLRPPL